MESLNPYCLIISVLLFLSELNRKEVDVITIPDKENTVVIINYCFWIIVLYVIGRIKVIHWT